MITNYFKTALRNFQRYFAYTAINVAGLAVGLATTMFILLWVTDETSYDSFHENSATLYRVWHNAHYTDGSIKTFASTPAPLGPAGKAEIPEIEFATRTDWGSALLFEYEKNSFLESGLWADPDLFKMFSFPIVKGNPERPLPDDNSVAISRKLARKYFLKEDPIGKIFQVSESFDAKVTAVFEDVPANSSMQFDFVLPFSKYERDRSFMYGKWENAGVQTYIKLHENASSQIVNSKMAALVKKNCQECLVSPFLQLYKDFHLYSDFKDGKPDGGAIKYVRIFSAVAIFILLIACVNFMNLATARSSTRSREVGVRKVIGAQRKNLIAQFLGESFSISVLGTIVALALVQIFLPSFNALTNKDVHFNVADGRLWLMLAGVVVFTGLFAGSYPAFFLSSFKPVSVLKGNLPSSSRESFIRKGLVVFQFSLAVILISVSIMVYKQVQFIREKDLGLDRRNIVAIDLRGSIQQNFESFKTEALRHSEILSVSATTDLPFNVLNTTSDPIWPGKLKDEVIPFKIILSDENLISMLNMTLLEGRNFSGEKSDTANYIVNEAAVRAMNLKDPIGSPFEMWFGKGKIIGVVKDFHNQDFRNTIDPLVFLYYPPNTWRMLVKLDGSNLEGSLKKLESVYKKFDSVYPFQYSFLDQHFNQQYQHETTTGRLAISFTVIAIFISCLGLFGLASFTAERRTKELGIRKILGATASNLVTLLCNDFARLVAIALLVGTPIAYFVTQAFLSQYVFKTDINYWIFVVTAVSIFAIAIATVMFQSIKAAITSPANSLRAE